MNVRFVTRSLAWLWVCVGLCGCASSVRGAARVAISLKDCPALTQLVLNNGVDWQASLGIEAGDAATLKAGIQAAQQIGSRAAELDAKLRATCLELASNLGTPLAPESVPTGDQACGQASLLMKQAKEKLGSTAKVASQSLTQCLPGCTSACNPVAPEGACARSTAAITITGASDEEAAARYRNALEVLVGSLLTIRDSAANARELVANARSAVELGLVTGNAVSDGDVAAAASAAVCIVPPLIAAKQNLGALRRDMRITFELARSAGLMIKRPGDNDGDDPQEAAPSKDRFAPQLVPALTQERLVNLFAFPDGGLAAQTRSGVIALPGGETLLRTMPERQLEWSIGIGTAAPGTTYCAVTTGRRVACIRSQSVFHDNKFQGTELTLMDSAGGARVVASVNDKGSLAPDGIAFTAAGELLYAYTQSEQRGNQVFTFARVNRSGAESQLPFVPEAGALEDLGGGGRANPPITFFEFNGRLQMLYRDGRTLLLAPYDNAGAATIVAELSAYDARPVVGGDNTLYIFYYETKSRTARVASSTDGVHFSGSLVDSRESGWQLEALPTPTGAVVVYYYFRNPSDKGLRAADLSRGKLVQQRALVMREDRWNAGWHPRLVQDRSQPTQGVVLSYLSNVEDDDRAWARYNSPADLVSGPKIVTDDGYKNWFVQVGAGVWYTWWHLNSPAPSASELDGAQLSATSYQVAPSLLLSANLEARWGPIDLGLSYAQNYLDDASKQLGESTRLLTGSIKIEDLLPGHDIKAEGVWGRYHGQAQRDVTDAAVPPDTATTTTERLPLDTSYVDVHLFALNQWRLKYGLGFSTYNIPAPILAYSAAAKQLHYDFAGSALRDVRFHNIDLAVGYSKLDYAAKYENRYFGPMFDVTIAGGVSIVSFDAVPTPEGDLTSAYGLHLRGNAMLGWLWMQRFGGLGGLGFYVRPTYAVEGSFAGNFLVRPDDRKEDKAEESDKQAAFEVLSLRHGPWLDVGIIW